MKQETGPFEEKYEGELAGHKITMIAKGLYEKPVIGGAPVTGIHINYTEISAVVDGLELPAEKARKLFYKFRAGPSESEKLERKDIENIQTEQRNFQMGEIEKDLGI